MDISVIRQHPIMRRLAPPGIQQRVVAVANLAAIALLTYTLAEITWLLVPHPEQERSSATSNLQPQERNNTEVRNLATEINRYHPFGKIDKAKSQTKPTTDAPETRLNLTLKGVIITGIMKKDRAIVTGSGSPEKAYAIDGELPGNGILREIYSDRIILERNNRLETLRLTKKGRSAASKSSGRKTSRPSKTSTNAKSQLSLREYRDRFINQPQDLANHVRVTPVYKDGNLQGVRLRTIKDRSLLRRHGLRKSDIITSVNGIKIDSEIKGLEILDNLREVEQVDLEITRNGRQHNLVLTLDK